MPELSFGPSKNVRHFKGYYVNEYKFYVNVRDPHRWITHNGVCARGSMYNGDETNYYGILVNIIKLHYGCNSVVLKYEWYNNTQMALFVWCNSVCIIQPDGIVEVNPPLG